MEDFLRAVGLVLTAVLLLPVVSQKKELGTVLSLAVCAAVGIGAAALLGPMVEFLEELQQTGNLERGYLSVLLKGCGIGLISDLAAMICADAGESAMGKAVQLLAHAAILLLSLPMLRQLLEILEEVLGRI